MHLKEEGVTSCYCRALPVKVQPFEYAAYCVLLLFIRRGSEHTNFIFQ